jgi:hypothetical protein
VPSINAINVANDVLENVRKGKLVNKKEIILKRGYAPSIATAPTKVTLTKSYQSVISPVVDQMVKARDRALNEINSRELDKVQYADLITAINKLSHDIQILSGGATENINVKPLATLDELRQNNSNEQDSQS